MTFYYLKPGDKSLYDYMIYSDPEMTNLVMELSFKSFPGILFSDTLSGLSETGSWGRKPGVEVYFGSFMECIDLVWNSYLRLFNDTLGFTNCTGEFFTVLKDSVVAFFTENKYKVEFDYNEGLWGIYNESDKDYLGYFKYIERLITSDYLTIVTRNDLNHRAKRILLSKILQYYPQLLEDDVRFQDVISSYQFV